MSVKEATAVAENCVLQNNQIDLFEEYFDGEQPDQTVENVNSKTLMLFKQVFVTIVFLLKINFKSLEILINKKDLFLK